jgi:hypothetical protein
MSLSFRPSPSLLLLALSGVSAVAMAGPQRDPHGARSQAPSAIGQEHAAQGHGVRGQDRGASRRHEDPLSDSVRRIERTTRGQVLSAERVPYDGRSLNRIKVVDERGRVRVYMDDPAQSRDGQPRGSEPTRGDDD